jgi:hypothetical protein
MEEIKQKNWFGRNWPWLLPVGGCLTVILLFVFGVGAVYFGVSKAIKNSTPYEYALAKAIDNSEAIAILGGPIVADGIFKGNISIKNEGGEADMEIPIKGPKGYAVIFVLADRIQKEWIYEELYIVIKETNEKINLLDKDLEGI